MKVVFKGIAVAVCLSVLLWQLVIPQEIAGKGIKGGCCCIGMQTNPCGGWRCISSHYWCVNDPPGVQYCENKGRACTLWICNPYPGSNSQCNMATLCP